MLLYAVQYFDTLENVFTCTFIYIQKEKTLRCKNLSDVQISYSDIGKIKNENTDLTKSGIWYLLCMLLIILFTLNLFQHNQTSTSSKRFCTSDRSFPSVFYLNGP